jgi:hydrogenase/urease accessory protein HupE
MAAPLLRLLATLIVLATAAGAHPIQQIDVVPEVGPGTWKLNWKMDAGSALEEIREDPTAVPPSRTQLMGYDAAQYRRMKAGAEEYLRGNLFLAMNDEPVEWRLEFPNFASDPPVFPNGAEVYPFIDLVLIGVEVPAGGGPLMATWKNDEVDLFVTNGSGEGAALTIVSAGENTEITVVPARAAATAASAPAAVATGSSAWRWIRYGFEHILPKGKDHILFILALFLLAPQIRPLLAQSLTFTLAHSATLFLTVFGVLNLPEKFVEAAILLSIAVVAVENIFRHKVPRHRLGVVFGFGLLHGMGFATVLRALPLPSSNIVWPVVSFNVGIEGAQIAVLASAWLLVGWFRNRPPVWRRIRVAGSVLILIALAIMLGDLARGALATAASCPPAVSHGG